MFPETIVVLVASQQSVAAWMQFLAVRCHSTAPDISNCNYDARPPHHHRVSQSVLAEVK